MHDHRNPQMPDTSWRSFGKAIGTIVSSMISGLMKALILLTRVFAISTFVAFPIKWLWNYSVVHLAQGAVAELGFWHALCLSWLCGILFKSSVSASTERRK